MTDRLHCRSPLMHIEAVSIRSPPRRPHAPRFTMKSLLRVVLLGCLWPAMARGDDLDQLARDFWAWRAVSQPFSGDDIPRIDRPAGWVPDWSAGAVEGQRKALAGLVARHQDPAQDGRGAGQKV